MHSKVHCGRKLSEHKKRRKGSFKIRLHHEASQDRLHVQIILQIILPPVNSKKAFYVLPFFVKKLFLSKKKSKYSCSRLIFR